MWRRDVVRRATYKAHCGTGPAQVCHAWHSSALRSFVLTNICKCLARTASKISTTTDGAGLTIAYPIWRNGLVLSGGQRQFGRSTLLLQDLQAAGPAPAAPHPNPLMAASRSHNARTVTSRTSRQEHTVLETRSSKGGSPGETSSNLHGTSDRGRNHSTRMCMV